ncbi:MAG TPA: DUF4242 domain-containing protein, partial [Dehalococcoidia bacterium]
MPLFLDVHHHIDDLSPETIAAGHARDLAVQDRHGVRFIKFWYDEATGKVFCLFEAPNKEAGAAVHLEADG